jgi:hypothetical protein
MRRDELSVTPSPAPCLVRTDVTSLVYDRDRMVMWNHTTPRADRSVAGAGGVDSATAAEDGAATTTTPVVLNPNEKCVAMVLDDGTNGNPLYSRAGSLPRMFSDPAFFGSVLSHLQPLPPSPVFVLCLCCVFVFSRLRLRLRLPAVGCAVVCRACFWAVNWRVV